MGMGWEEEEEEEEEGSIIVENAGIPASSGGNGCGGGGGAGEDTSRTGVPGTGEDTIGVSGCAEADADTDAASAVARKNAISASMLSMVCVLVPCAVRISVSEYESNVATSDASAATFGARLPDVMLPFCARRRWLSVDVDNGSLGVDVSGVTMFSMRFCISGDMTVERFIQGEKKEKSRDRDRDGEKGKGKMDREKGDGRTTPGVKRV